MLRSEAEVTHLVDLEMVVGGLNIKVHFVLVNVVVSPRVAGNNLISVDRKKYLSVNLLA